MHHTLGNLNIQRSIRFCKSNTTKNLRKVRDTIIQTRLFEGNKKKEKKKEKAFEAEDSGCTIPFVDFMQLFSNFGFKERKNRTTRMVATQLKFRVTFHIRQTNNENLTRSKHYARARKL